MDAFAPPILGAVRAATTHLHDRIEAAPALARLMAPDLDRDAYVAVLQATFRFQAAMQAAVPARLARLGIGWAVPAHVIGALVADLASLGAPVPHLPRPPGLGRGFGPVGALYVIEGSLLGGRVIGRHVGEKLGVTPDWGGAFFCGMTADTARARWRSFCTLLSGLPDSATPSMCRGAVLGFQFFLGCLDGHAAVSETAPLAHATAMDAGVARSF